MAKSLFKWQNDLPWLNTKKLCTTDCVIVVIDEHTRCTWYTWIDNTKVKIDKIIISNFEASPIFYIAVKYYITITFNFTLFILKHLRVIYKLSCFIHFILWKWFSNFFFVFKDAMYVIVIYLCFLYVNKFSIVYK